MATHSSILAWRIPWTEEPGGLQSMESQGVRYDWAHMPRNSRARTQVRQMKYPEHMHKLVPPAGTRSMCCLRFCALSLVSALGVSQTLVWVQQHCSLPWIHGQHQLSSYALWLAHSVIGDSSSRAWFIISCCQRLVSSPACMIHPKIGCFALILQNYLLHFGC